MEISSCNDHIIRQIVQQMCKILRPVFKTWNGEQQMGHIRRGGISNIETVIA